MCSGEKGKNTTPWMFWLSVAELRTPEAGAYTNSYGAHESAVWASLRQARSSLLHLASAGATWRFLLNDLTGSLTHIRQMMPDSPAGAVTGMTHRWPLPVTCASSQHCGWVPGWVSWEKEPGKRPVSFRTQPKEWRRITLATFHSSPQPQTLLRFKKEHVGPEYCFGHF